MVRRNWLAPNYTRKQLRCGITKFLILGVILELFAALRFTEGNQAVFAWIFLITGFFALLIALLGWLQLRRGDYVEEPPVNPAVGHGQV
jgi:cytochrome bd-type quinol oxidase subunit 1